MVEKSRIIILHTIKHSDTGVVIQCYSQKSGRQALYFRVSTKNKTAHSILQRLNIVEVVTTGKGISMPTVKEITPLFRFEEIRCDIFKSTIAIFISELLLKSIKESEENPHLYAFLESSVNILESLPGSAANFHIHFIVHLCKLLGFMPKDNYSETMRIFNPFTASFCQPAPLNGAQTPLFNEKESLLLHKLMNTQAISLADIESSGELRLSFAKKMIKYLSIHLGMEIEINSLDVLHEVFS